MNVKIPLAVLGALLAGGCDNSLDSLEGPASGSVSGLVCDKLPTLSSALEFPVSRQAMIDAGHCLMLRRPERVRVLRTVSMPAEGKYSQFELELAGKSRKLWIRTDSIRG